MVEVGHLIMTIKSSHHLHFKEGKQCKWFKRFPNDTKGYHTLPSITENKVLLVIEKFHEQLEI